MNYRPELSHFDLDMKRGAQAELFVDDIARALAAGTGSIEVKRDSWFVHSRRLYVEYECRGRDGKWRKSGIAATKATMWAFQCGAHPIAFFVSTEILKEAARRAYLGGQVGNCSYGQNPTRGVFVNIDDICNARDESLDERMKKNGGAA